MKSGKRRLVLVTCWLTFAAACGETALPTVSYPPTKAGDVVDDYFGTKVADPYRWMEDLDSKDVADWVAAQNRVTSGYLDTLPMRDHFRRRITELWDYPQSVAAGSRGRTVLLRTEYRAPAAGSAVHARQPDGAGDLGAGSECAVA